MAKYDFAQIEKKWQKVWARHNYAAWHARDSDRRKKFYVLDMFPYPSGDGMHVGHVEGYTATDIYARWLRRRGFNVLHPMGWDAFGLPAENYAIKTKTHPAKIVQKSISRFKNQLLAMGFSYDWRREVNTTDPAYYRWTQWIFLQLFKRGLAYKAESAINWCASCKIGLANEEVIAGECERCGFAVEKKIISQWTLKITAYADRLLKDLEGLDWPENIKEMQRNWIGRSEGYEVEFKVAGREQRVKVFTTRLDTIFGATFLVLAPEHPLIDEIVSATESRNVAAYRKEVSQRSDLERQSEVKLQTGVFSGSYAINPATREKIPIWISEYVLASYGTGAIMGVPAHDSRDFSFATAFHLPVREVIAQDGRARETMNEPYEGEGALVNSGPFSRMPSRAAMEKIAGYVTAKPAVRYKLRDWIFSRQRYWGEPIPLIFCEVCKKSAENSKFEIRNPKLSEGEVFNPGWVPIAEKDLPLTLPPVEFYEPTGTGESPLAAMTEWVNVKCPRCSSPAKRETDTMPQWAGSCWYYAAYCVRRNSKYETLNSKNAKKLLKHWLPVNLYVGGAEHAILHLLYARFWHKALFDIGLLPTAEPFQKLVNQGMILGADGEKMSKSRGNVVSPDELIASYGADSLRMYEMFMGPLEQVKPWDTQGIVGVYRFLNRVWNLCIGNQKFEIRNPKQKGEILKPVKISRKARAAAGADINRLMHKTIKKVTDDIGGMRFNTAIAALMEFQSALSFQAHLLSPRDFHKALDALISLLAPFAPHIAEELWSYQRKFSKRGSTRIKTRINADVSNNQRKSVSIHEMDWPKYNPRWLKTETITYVIQVNGKLRDTMKTKAGLEESEVVGLAKKRPKVVKWLADKKITRQVFVKDKLVNFVI